MCKALEDLYQDGVNEGREQGMECGIKVMISLMQEDGYDKERILKKLREGFSLDDEKANAYFEKFVRE